MQVASLCSGVGGTDLGFERAGMTVVGQVEWDEKCQDVLRRHWPDVVLRSDLKDVKGNRGTADLVAGGTPCQDLSVAGRRAGLDGERLQGFPDDWTLTGASGKEIADSHRYRMMGNSVAVPVFEWVGQRIMAVAAASAARVA